MDKTQVKESEALRKAALAARERSRILRETMGNRELAGLANNRRPPSIEHFHLIYHVPKDNLAIPYYNEFFATDHDARERMHAMALEAAPNSEWYEEGLVGIETTIHGRSGLYWLLLEPARCIRSACAKNMPRDFRKRQLILVRDEAVVPYIRG